LDEPPLTAYLRHRGLGPDDTRDVVPEVFARSVTSGGRTVAPSIATPGAARSARRPTCRRWKRPAAPSAPVLASRRSGRRPFPSSLGSRSGRPCRPGPAMHLALRPETPGPGRPQLALDDRVPGLYGRHSRSDSPVGRLPFLSPMDTEPPHGTRHVL